MSVGSSDKNRSLLTKTNGILLAAFLWLLQWMADKGAEAFGWDISFKQILVEQVPRLAPLLDILLSGYVFAILCIVLAFIFGFKLGVRSAEQLAVTPSEAQPPVDPMKEAKRLTSQVFATHRGLGDGPLIYRDLTDRMKASIATLEISLRKAGFAVPDLPQIWTLDERDTFKRYLLTIGSMLDAGHIDEAKKTSEALTASWIDDLGKSAQKRANQGNWRI